MLVRRFMMSLLLVMSFGGCKSADQSPLPAQNDSGEIAKSELQATPSKPVALGFRTGVIYPETTITLAQLTEESTSPDFVERYLGKHITITQLIPTGGGESKGCGPVYSMDGYGDLNVTIWYDGKPEYDIGMVKILKLGNKDSISNTKPLNIPFDACSQSVIAACGYSTLKTEKPATCPFDFKRLKISGFVAAISPHTDYREIHLIPHGLID